MNIVNNCGAQIDPAFFPTVQDHDRNPTGGFALPAGEQYTVYLLSGWSGRIWGRTGCDADGNCATGGGCQGGVNCTSPAPGGPTLAQFTIDAYVPSLYSVPVTWADGVIVGTARTTSPRALSTASTSPSRSFPTLAVSLPPCRMPTY